MADAVGTVGTIERLEFTAAGGKRWDVGVLITGNAHRIAVWQRHLSVTPAPVSREKNSRSRILLWLLLGPPSILHELPSEKLSGLSRLKGKIAT